MGVPQLRPMLRRAQTANANPRAKRASPTAARHGSVLAPTPRKTLKRSRTTTMTAIRTLTWTPRDHETRPFFTPKAATIQYNQKAAHPTAKTISTAGTGNQSAILRGDRRGGRLPTGASVPRGGEGPAAAGAGRLRQGLSLGGAGPVTWWRRPGGR